MRKHFLILMLLTLLPLAGFAEDLDMTKFVAENINYGATVLPGVSTGTPATYTEGTHYEVSTVYYTDEALTNEKAVSALPTQGSGQYWLKITGKGTYEGQVYPLSFWIIGTSIATATIADPYTNNVVTYTGTAFTPKPAVTIQSGTETVTLQENVHFTYSYENNKNVGTTARVIINGMGNYSGQASKTFEIKKATLTASMVTSAPTAIAGLEYTGEPQILVQDGTVNVPADNAGVVFNYSSDNGQNWYAAGDNNLKRTNAGSYPMIWKVVGGTNYNDYVPTENNTVTGNIDKAMLIARAQNLTTYYGKILNANNNVQIQYEDYEGNVFTDTQINAIFTAPYAAPTASFASKVGATQPFAAGTYTDGIVLTGGSAQNYEIIPVNATLKINEAKLRLTLMQDKTAAYGTDASKENEWQLKATDLYWTSATTNLLKLEYQSGEDANGNPTYTQVVPENNTDAKYVDAVKKYLVVDTKTTNSTYKNITGLKMKANDNTSGAVNTAGYALTLEGATAQKNYTLDYEGAYVSTKKFTVTPAALTIKAANKVKTYGQKDPDLSFTVEGGTLTKDMSEKIQKALRRAPGQDAGNYVIDFGETNPQFEGYNITWQTGKLVIQKAKLIITATEQSLYTANTADELNKSAFTVSGLVTADKDETKTGIDDDADVSLAFAPAVYDFKSFIGNNDVTLYTGKVKVVNMTADKTTVEVTENQVASFVGNRYVVNSTTLDPNATYPLFTEDGTATNISVKEVAWESGVQIGAENKLIAQNAVDEGIVVTLKNEADLAANYNITLNAGKLTVVDLTSTLLLANNDNTAAIQATDGTTVNVVFGSREIKREIWTTMVLPFATTVTEVSQKLGYAVVNIVDQASYSGNDLHMKLHMGAIEANQPFLVKYYKDDVPAVYFTADEAATYNAGLNGAIPASTNLTAGQATAYNAAMQPTTAKNTGDQLTAEEAAAYNATLTGAVSTQSIKVAAIDYSTFDLAGRQADNTVIPNIAAYDGVQFGQKEIVYSADVQDADSRGNIFFGVFAPTDVYGHEYATTTKTGAIKRLGSFSADDPFTVVPTAGYFKMADAAARIFIEEPDGSTTVIKGINADGEAIVDNEGWYTLNGVKLQGAPTQKGIYINNGKKIVVK